MAKGSKREGGGIGELLAYAGDRKFLTYLGMALSAFSQLLSFGRTCASGLLRAI